MLAVLEALVAMRQAAISTVAFVHELETDRQTDAYPRSVLSARAPGDFVTPVCVPLDVTETLTADVLNESQHDAFEAAVDSLRELPVCYMTATARIHSHGLVREAIERGETRVRAVLTWKVVASWA